ncbi:hypothetical protein DIURU_002571 [Diutina rugosa]|uniref:Uncharacterized protein n=1 Tax=Diutina rugosa TaxID=5481 RepID=A0A642UPS9_DIURU|nr:uncharacterized protein DIURU_002571 [Diutina rugosa]KAA8903061.1 hypothetical protein DIURU_002571 [Diutina rugosa]
MEAATELPRFHFFPEFPKDIQLKIYERTDVPSVCRFYAACASDPAYKVTCKDAKYYFNRKVVEVTPEVVVTGDHRQIDFYTYSMLPPCDIRVTTPIGLLAMTKWHLTQVKAQSVSLIITNIFSQRVPCSLLGLGDNVVVLAIEGIIDGAIEIDPREFPLSVEKLTTSRTIFKVAPDLRHLTNLVSYDSDYDSYYDSSDPNNVRLSRISVFQLPSSLTTLNGNLWTNLSTSELPNFKHFRGHELADAFCNQVETANVWRFNPRGRFSKLREITVGRGYPSFKGCECPQLEKVKFCGYHGTDGRTQCDVSDLFTSAQQAQLVSLKGAALVVIDMAPFKNLEVLHMKLEKILTADFPLPPKLKELMIWSDFSVTGIPATLEVFVYSYDAQSASNVVVKSPNLRELRVYSVKCLTIDCPNLTSLNVWDANNLGALEVPNLEKLDVNRVPFPLIVHGAPFPLERLTRLNHLLLRGNHIPGSKPRFDRAQRVVIGHRLKSVTLDSMELSEVSISSDEVTIHNCSFENTPRIRATILTSPGMDFNTSDVVCRELECWSMPKRAVPQMVEKLIVDEYKRYRVLHSPFYGRLSDPSSFVLDGYNRLRSVFVHGYAPKKGLSYKLSFAASMKHLRIGVEALGNSAEIRFAEHTQLEHLECWALASKEQLGITEYPPSCYFPQGVRTETGTDYPGLQESKLRQHSRM